MKIKKVLISVLAVLCASMVFVFSGCVFFDYDGIFAVRNRVEKLRKEMSETLIEAFKDENILAVKELFCQKSQEFSDIDEQIQSTFNFIEGQIESFKVSSSTKYEGYASDYGKVDEYSFGSSIYITTDTVRSYELYFLVHYIGIDSSIEGMAYYMIDENNGDYEDNKQCKAGYNWMSPYDGECGVISAKLITAVAQKDTHAIKNLLCQKTLENPQIDNEIQAVLEFFQGKPLFTESEDGLNDDQSENDFVCLVSCSIERDKDGTIETVVVSVIVNNIITDTGKDYSMSFDAYLQCDSNPQNVGIFYFSFKDDNSEVQKQVGEWIDE